MLTPRHQINLIHVILVGPLLIYFGTIKDCNQFHKHKLILLVLGLLVLAYHIYRLTQE
jgi:uncharacterized membrane protein